MPNKADTVYRLRSGTQSICFLSSAVEIHRFKHFLISKTTAKSTQSCSWRFCLLVLNNKNGRDEKCSQCACFWLKIIKEILFGVWDLLQNSFDSGIIYRWREISFKKKTIWLILLGVQLLRISTDQTTSSPEMRKRFLLIHSPWSCWRRKLIELIEELR